MPNDAVKFKGLKEDALAGIREVLGADSAEAVVANFDDPKKYPKDFLDEYLDFMQKLIGADVAEKKIAPLYRKYRINHRAISPESPLSA